MPTLRNMPFVRAIADEGELLDVLVRIDARALQRRLELLDVVGHDAVAQRLRRLRIAQIAIVDRNDLLHGRGDDRLRVAA